MSSAQGVWSDCELHPSSDHVTHWMVEWGLPHCHLSGQVDKRAGLSIRPHCLPVIVGVACEKAVVPHSPRWEVGSHDPTALYWHPARGYGLYWSHDFEGMGHVCAAEWWLLVASSVSATPHGYQSHQSLSSKPTPKNDVCTHGEREILCSPRKSLKAVKTLIFM